MSLMVTGCGPVFKKVSKTRVRDFFQPDSCSLCTSSSHHYHGRNAARQQQAATWLYYQLFLWTLLLQKHLHKRLTNGFVVFWISVTIVVHWPYDEWSKLIGTVFGLVLSWPVTCPQSAFRPALEMNLSVAKKAIPRVTGLRSKTPQP